MNIVDSISFILPKSFKKSSMKHKIPLRFHCIHEVDLPENSFIIGKKKHDVPCIFQIWKKKEQERHIEEKLYPIHYIFVKKDENPDISFRRVGVYAGKIDRRIDDKNSQSHYFIKFDQQLTPELFNNLSNIIFLHSDDTVGPKSISKQELIKEYNNIM